MNRKRVTLFALLISIAILFTGCFGGYKIGGKVITQYSSEELDVYSKLAQNVVTMMGGDTAEHLNSMSATKEITFEKEWQQWQDYIATYGPLQDYTVGSAWKYGDDTIVIATAQFGETHICFDSRWTSRNKLIEICMYQYPPEEEAQQHIPEGVVEKDIILNEGSEYELPGKITMPENAAEGSLPAAVLIVGTGANNMDHTAGVTHSYRDLAWYLAEKGIATIRYDKRTNRYGSEWETPSMEKMNVDWETIDDAVAAYEMLKSQPEVDENRIFCIGHSLGGLMIPRIDKRIGDAFAGYVLIAVPDRPWQGAAYDQYIHYGLAGAGSDNEIYTMASMLESELKTINNKLDSYSDEDLLRQNMLGMPGIYWKDLNSFDYIAAYEATEKPMLILQGESDYQIYAEVDFAGWQKKMEGHDNCTCILYEGLNHLLLPSRGCFRYSYKEYDMPAHIPDEVIEDIAGLIGKAS